MNLKPWSEQEEVEYKEMSGVFIGYLKKAYEEGAEKGWTEEQIREANPILFAGVDAIQRISKCSEEEIAPVGQCVYCNELVFKDESYVNETCLLHTDCEKDIMAEIQDQQRWV